MKVTAKLEYRNYVPSGWIAFEFTHLNFYGSEELSEEWNVIRRTIEHQVSDEEEDLKNTLKKEEESKEQWRRLSFWNKFKSYPEQETIIDLQERLERFNRRFSHTATKTRHAATNFLRQKGFVLTQSGSSGGECEEHTEIYEQGL